MRAPFATVCLALALAGCRGTGGGMFGQMTIPPLGTQPPGALLADNSYYPGATSTFGSAARATTAPSTPNPTTEPSFAQPGNSQVTDRRGAAISRSSLGTPARTTAPTVREEPIRIPDDSTSLGSLAAVVPIRGLPTTDATGLFDAVRSQLGTRTSLVARAPSTSGFVEISQLPDAPAALRRAALSGQSLR